MPRPSTVSIDDLLTRLLRIAEDLAWSWHEPVQRPFAMLDPIAWEATNHAPIETVLSTPKARLAAAAADVRFLQTLETAERTLEDAQRAPRWFKTNHRGRDRRLKVAYYCSEFAIHESMQQYSGGLGVLAGDHVKSAEDLGVPAGGGRPALSPWLLPAAVRSPTAASGSCIPTYDFDRYPIEETGTSIACPIGRRTVTARIMRLTLGNTSLLLLDADLPENRPADRRLTEGLYKGEPDLRMRQQVLLGVGGAMALEAMDERPTVHHLNEGHAAFAAVERIARLVEDGLDQSDAIARVRASTVFTTHTPVPAGHDRYPSTRCRGGHERRPPTCRTHRPLLRRSRSGDAGRPVGTAVHDDPRAPARRARQRRGQTPRRGEPGDVARRSIPEARRLKDVPIGSITNGVHPGTWLDPAAAAFWRKHIRLKPEIAKPDESRVVEGDERRSRRGVGTAERPPGPAGRLHARSARPAVRAARRRSERATGRPAPVCAKTRSPSASPGGSRPTSGPR